MQNNTWKKDVVMPSTEPTKEADPLHVEVSENEIQIYPNKKTTLIFQFLYHPEYLGVNNKMIINTDHFKAFGVITQLIPEKIDPSIRMNEKGQFVGRPATTGAANSNRVRSSSR